MTKKTSKPKASKVLRGWPRWLFPLVIAKYGISGKAPDGEKIHHVILRGLIESFLLQSRTVNQHCIPWGFLDHVGHDSDGNLISEAYIRGCPGCQQDAAMFAARLGVRYELSDATYHAPERPELMRLTFFKPVQRQRGLIWRGKPIR